MTSKQLKMRKSIPFDVSILKEENDLYKYFPKKELEKSLKELAYMEKHKEKYKSYNDIGELFKDLDNE